MNINKEFRILDLVFSICFVGVLFDMLKKIMTFLIPNITLYINFTYQIAFVIIYLVLVAGLYSYLEEHELL